MLKWTSESGEGTYIVLGSQGGHGNYSLKIGRDNIVLFRFVGGEDAGDETYSGHVVATTLNNGEDITASNIKRATTWAETHIMSSIEAAEDERKNK